MTVAQGHEIAVLSASGWDGVRAVLVEDDQLEVSTLDTLMQSRGYQPRARFLSDSLFTHLQFGTDVSSEAHSNTFGHTRRGVREEKRRHDQVRAGQQRARITP